MKADLVHGDCLEEMKAMPDCSIDAVVTDPPYGLGFMGQQWDALPPGQEVFEECLRLLKPGGHLLAFGGSRTYHRLAVAVEDAGFEVRDQIMWLYGSGFPKSHNLGGGLGTALKPAHEPIVLARKPLAGTVAATVEAFGTGALNVDRCRVPTEEQLEGGAGGLLSSQRDGTPYPEENGYEPNPGGRWPANVAHDGSAALLQYFPEAGGQQGAITGDEPSCKMGAANCYGHMDSRHEAAPRAEVDRSAARFFYCAKADRTDRDEGCEDLNERPLHWSSGVQNPGSFQSDNTRKDARNNHPTVKPTPLMRWLCRLVTPPGGTVLDPFMGSGSTGKAAVLEGFRFVGIEAAPEYLQIAQARIDFASRQGLLFAEGF